MLRDFVEAPPQMLEAWVCDKRVLALFQEVCPACKPVPAEMIDKARVTRDHAKGIFIARQHLYASFDLALHASDAPEPMDLRTAFAANRLDAAVGRRYLEKLLAQGSQRPPAELFQGFLARETNASAFFEDLKK